MINISHSIEIKCSPKKVFDFFKNLDKNYRKWHPKDHVVFKLIKGKPLKVGSIAYAEEYMHGKLHKLKLEFTKITPEEIEYKALPKILRLFAPVNRFLIKKKGNKCVFTAENYVRAGPLFGKLFKKEFDDVRRHVREEGENLKRLME